MLLNCCQCEPFHDGAMASKDLAGNKQTIRKVFRVKIKVNLLVVFTRF